MPSVSPRDVALLFALETELPSLRRGLELAQMIAEHPLSSQSRNPVLNFAFNNCTVAQIENSILRMTEALDVLDTASGNILNEPILTERDGGRRPVDDDLYLLKRLRNKRIAHRVIESRAGDELWHEVQARFGTIYQLLFTAMDKIEAYLSKLADAGLFDVDYTLQATDVEVKGFDKSQIARLVVSANALVDGKHKEKEAIHAPTD